MNRLKALLFSDSAVRHFNGELPLPLSLPHLAIPLSKIKKGIDKPPIAVYNDLRSFPKKWMPRLAKCARNTL
jgi:hypothetical protein